MRRTGWQPPIDLASAALRLLALDREEQEIVRAFPELRALRTRSIDYRLVRKRFPINLEEAVLTTKRLR